ncbi:hypothetical protein [Tessaracoccus caeni]|uniref:hypothetical protein n=1 Tax=Tessaracoccus caeni TaxID=3031239 RepID=UPI0023DBF8DC|nr:hypothetical protein [Tessaracoccus caeni]MDF1488883.1 hypothetical protein [Tessaracoccus caeni]
MRTYTSPDLPTPEDILRDDGELLGGVVPTQGSWIPTTSFGAALGKPTDYEHAVDVVHERGLASLAETWWIRLAGTEDWLEAELMEVTPEHLRIRWTDPMLDQPPSGHWVDVTTTEISLNPVLQ